MKSYLMMAFAIAMLTACEAAYAQDSFEQQGIPVVNSEFTFSRTTYPGSKVRFAAFPNLNYPIFLALGRNNPYVIEAGFNLRNLGTIYRDSVKHKVRGISIGIPLKFYIIKKPQILIGGEFDYVFHSKEKSYFDKKVKTTTFDVDRINRLQASITAEVRMSKSIRLKGNYFLTDLLNTSYAEDVNGVSIKPYQHGSNLYSISVVCGLIFITAPPTIIRLFTK
ncbi:MAG: hypothetical protein ABW007_13110 [Chitinophagaceae bacterium]